MDKKLRNRSSTRGLEHSNLINAGALIYCSSTHRYLFLLRNGSRYGNSWGLVGGKINDTEKVIDGLYREINEEISLDLKLNKIIPVETFTSDSGKFTYHTYVLVVDREFVPTLNHEHRGFCWVGLEDHPRPLHPGVWRTFNFKVVVDKLKTIETVL